MPEPPALSSRARDREIVRLALPALGALVAEPLFLLADAAVVGRLGTRPLAGLGLAATVLATVVGLCVFLAYSTTGAVARRVGAGQWGPAVRQGVDGMWFGLALGVALAAVGWRLVAPLVDLLGASQAVAPYAVTYLRISLLGLPAMLVVLAGAGVLRGLQDTGTTLVVTAVAAAANLALAATLVLGLGWGIAGSAWATVVAQTGAAAGYGAVVVHRARRHQARLRPDGAGLRAVARLGGPLLVRTAALRLVFVAAVVVAARLGDAELAAYHVALQTWMLLSLALDALAIAAQALVGRALGAGEPDAARADARRLLQWGTGAGAALGLLVVAVSPWYPSLFAPSPEVRALLVPALLVVAAHEPVAGPVFVLDGVLIGAGDARWLAGASVVVLVAFLPAAALVLAAHGSVAWLLAALLWFLLVRLALLAWRARGDRWLVVGAGAP